MSTQPLLPEPQEPSPGKLPGGELIVDAGPQALLPDEPWERLPGEPKKAYDCFAYCRDSGITCSYRDTAKHFSRSLALVGHYGIKWN